MHRDEAMLHRAPALRWRGAHCETALGSPDTKSSKSAALGGTRRPVREAQRLRRSGGWFEKACDRKRFRGARCFVGFLIEFCERGVVVEISALARLAEQRAHRVAGN